MTAQVVPLLTARQRRILAVIRDHYTQRGYCPSVRDIAEQCGLRSPSAVVYQLQRLVEMGWIRRAPGRARAIELLNPEDGSDT